MNKKIATIILLVLTVLMIIMGIQKISVGYEKKNEYYNSDTYSSLNKNAYVGGDAYNYIINGTYFTAYMIQGMGFLIIATMSGISALLLNVNCNGITKKEEEKLPEL